VDVRHASTRPGQELAEVIEPVTVGREVTRTRHRRDMDLHQEEAQKSPRVMMNNNNNNKFISI